MNGLNSSSSGVGMDSIVAKVATLQISSAGFHTTMNEEKSDKILPILPSEVLNMAFSYLEVPDIKAVRLVSKHWSSAASTSLFKTFILRLDRPDVERLDSIRSAELTTGIKTFRLNIGSTPLDDMIVSLAQICLTWVRRLRGAQSWEAQSEFARFTGLEILRAEAVTEFALWFTRCHAEKKEWRTEESMVALMEAVPAVDSIEISSLDTPLTNVLNLDVWEPRVHPTYNIQIFVNLLKALSRSKNEIKRLSYDDLPVELFGCNRNFLKGLALPLRFLTHIHLRLKPHLGNWERKWTGFGKFMISMSLLKHIYIAHSGSHYRALPMTHMAMREAYIPLWKVFETHTWKSLETLRLDGYIFCETGLVELLDRHRATLRYVELSNMALWSGTFQGLLTWVRNHLKLDKFDICGLMEAFHSSHGEWVLDLSDLDCELWSAEMKTRIIQKRELTTRDWLSQEPPQFYDAQSVDRRLRAFATRRGPDEWPINQNETITYREPQIHSTSCEGCVQTRADIDADWDLELSQTAPRPTTTFMSDPQLRGVGSLSEAKLDSFFNESGYDTHGFDKHGHDNAGRHIEDYPLVNQNGNVNLMGWINMNRIIRNDILSQIPGFPGTLQGNNLIGNGEIVAQDDALLARKAILDFISAPA